MSSTHAVRIRSLLAIAIAVSTVAFVLVVQPARADFTPPNTPKLTKSVEVTAETGPFKTFYDSVNGVIHVLGNSTLTTYDATTLEVKMSMGLSAGDTFSEYGNAFDAEHATIFATLKSGGNSQLEAYVYSPADGQYNPYDANIPSQRTVVYSSALDRVYSIATGNSENITPSVAAATRDPDTGLWVAGPSYSDINSGSSTAVLGVSATTDGTLIGTYVPTVTGGGPTVPAQLTRKPIYSFTDTGSELTPTAIPGTQLAPGTVDYPGPDPVGYSDFAPMSGGSFTATETNFGAPSRQMITLDPTVATVANPSGFAVNATTLTLPFQPMFTEFDANGDLYLSSSDTLSLYRDGALFASSGAGPAIQAMSGGGGKIYAISGASAPNKLAVYSVGGYSPTITTDPSSQSISVTSNAEAKNVTLHSGASGTPAPTARWQKRAAGGSTWNDISGATGPDLTFGATAADNGSSYRAVYTNVAGEIATAAAQLTVIVNPPPSPLGPPDPAAPQVNNGKSVKLKFKKGKSARVTVGTVTCASASTCVYTLPASIKFKIGKKSFKASVTGPASLEPGQSQAVYATVSAGAIKALKGKKSKLIVSVQVANSVGRMHETAKSIIANIRA